ncbi:MULTISPECIES: hypothetical protein [unclassified Butyrivibrio]|uniref:hypothetical protein n=1 Tax=unclassified Butyrivibrio TaxID=2639466 RepID=UPI0005D13A6C|nr:MULTISPECIES: hypothetical protein [unclassified Butyrivibrio]
MQTISGKHNFIVNFLVAILGMTMVFVVLFSAIFVATESLHDCTGDECPVCAILHQCENNLNQLGDGIIALAVALIVITLPVAVISEIGNHRIYSTPVSEMVRLNN